jgi:hypothetical protein
MVEPHILLSQLYWKHRTVSQGVVAVEKALQELELVATTGTPRREVLTNLGMLQLGKAKASNETEIKIAETNILTAQIAHGYPAGHHSLALLASNAACIRLTSTLSRFGDAFLAEKLILEALSIVRNSGHLGTGAAYRNAAVFYAVQGYTIHALTLLQEGMNATLKAINEAEIIMEKHSGKDKTYIARTAKSNVAYHKDTYRALQRLLLTIQSHLALLHSWSLTTGPVVGEDVEPRMTYLGVECYMEMLWW